MLATATPLVRASLVTMVVGYLREFLRTLSQTRAIGVDTSFVQQVAAIRAWHENLEVPDGCGGRMFISGCSRCKTANVLSFPYDRVVFRGSIMGRRYGTMHFRVPVCSRCDREPPSPELIAPILVYRGKRRDGFVDLPERLAEFLSVRIDTDTAT